MGLFDSLKQRLDGWSNIVTGLGVSGVDKRLATQMGYINILPDVQLSALFHGDDIAHKIVSCLPDEALSRGYEIVGPDPEIVSEWYTAMEELYFWTEFRRAAIFSRLYGGGAMIFGIDDGQQSPEAQSLPLREDNIRRVEWIKYVDRRRLTRLYAGEGLYRFSPLNYTGMQSQKIIHESRMVFFGGAETDDETRLANGGWDLSVLQRVYPVLRDNAGAWASASLRLQESAYSKTVIKDLAVMMAAGRTQAVKDRLEILNYSRSAAKTIVLDSEEAYTRDIDNLSGMDSMLEAFQARVAAAADMPVTKLFGTSAKGLNATGEGDANDWYMKINAHRTGYLQPALERALELVASASEGPFRGDVPEQWSVMWPELEPMSDKERAEIYRANAEADSVYLSSQVLRPEEIALHRFKNTGYDQSPAIAIDTEEREESMALGKDFDDETVE